MKNSIVEKIYHFLKRYYRWVLGLVFLILLTINALIFYQHVYLVVESEPSYTSYKLSVNQEKLQKILENIGDREDNLSRVIKIDYPDLFSR